MQACMSLSGADLPLGRSTEDKKMRRAIFDVIAPYIMSAADMLAVQEAGDQIKDLWLETFTNSQKVMINSTLNAEAKAYFDHFFPGKGNIPSVKYANLVGLGPGQSILHRYDVTPVL